MNMPTLLPCHSHFAPLYYANVAMAVSDVGRPNVDDATACSSVCRLSQGQTHASSVFLGQPFSLPERWTSDIAF